MTLTEFLLERIGEDEAAAGNLHDIALCDVVEGTSDPRFGWECSCSRPARVLAECEAKRRIVEDARAAGADAMANGARGAVHFTKRILRHLALPHADHPDYREEWKP